MFNLSDKELDRLSREAADAYEVEKNTSSWNALEHRLDQELGTAPRPNPAVPPPRRFLYPIAYTSLIILLSSGYFLLKSSNKNKAENKINYTLSSSENSKTENKSSVDSSAKKDDAAKTILEENKNSVNANASAATKTTVKDETKNIANSSPNDEKKYLGHLKSVAEKELAKKNEKSFHNNEANNASAIKHNDVLKHQHLSKELSASSDNNKIKKGHSNNDFAKTKAAGDKLKNISDDEANDENVLTSSNKNDIASKENNNLISASDKNNSKPTNSDAASEEDLKYATTRIIAAAKLHIVIISDSDLLAESAKQQDLINLAKKNKSLTINRSLQIGLTFAPDFSKVKYVYENYHIGTSIGVTVGYQLLHKLSVNSGVIYADKYYQADGQDFHQPQQFNAALANEHVEFVRGSFKMIELPLNLRYDFSADGNTMFFVNGGLSSYFILNQSNAYFCHDYVGAQRWIKESDGQNQNYWFSMLNLSFGFETFLQKNISLQIDPYVKLPLRSIGVGNMQLSSYGINIGLKYSPVLKRSRH